MLLEVFDLESLSNLFTYTGYRSKTKTWYQYVICKWRNDAKLLYEHLTEEKFIQCGLGNKIKEYLAPIIEYYNRKSGELLESCEADQQPSQPLTKLEGSETNS